jgi:IS605 OrfB family transposase
MDGVRVSTGHITFSFDMPVTPEVTSGTTVGVDVGVNVLFACSDRQVAPTDDHGWTMSKIAERIARRRYGSKGFARAAAHRDSFVNWSVKQLNLDGVKTVKMENLKGLKQRPVSRAIRGWLYPALQERVTETCRRYGVHVEQVSPTFTSQRCSHCGWTRRANRRGESFTCGRCGFTAHSDVNAALNLSLNLEPLSGRERREKMNVIGFFWHESPLGQERMVPDVQRVNE